MIENKEGVREYIFLAAYKRELGMQMEKAEILMGTIEKATGLTHPEAIKLRLEGMDLVEATEKI